MYLYGAGGHARVIIEILELVNISIEGIFDDNPDIWELMGYKVWHPSEKHLIPGDPFIISIGNNYLRKEIATKYSLVYSVAKHPSAVFSPRSSLGQGSVVMANATVNSGTVAGAHTILNTSCTIEHDCSLGDFVHISPNACLSGGVTLGEGTQIGAGAVIIPNIRIGKWVVVGAGAVIIEDVPDYSVVAGNPGRIIKTIRKAQE
jgi:sugar O-acyltransferase (sialic acid O-acetyltransferase NeuD family)